MTVRVLTQAGYMAQSVADRQAGQEFVPSEIVALPGPTHAQSRDGKWHLLAVAVPVADLDTHPRSDAYRSALKVHRDRLADLEE